MRTIVIWLVVLCQGMDSMAQTTAVIRPLSIGDTVPDIEFPKLLNYPSKTARLSDFKGKIVIIDFWATWCGPCVKGLAKLDSLQKKFSNQLMVLPVSHEHAEVVTKFLSKRSELKLPSTFGFGDTILWKLFPHNIIPHAVIINQEGIVSAITASQYISEANISALLKGQKVQLPSKRDLKGFNALKPLIIDNNGGTADNMQYHTMITKYLEGVPSTFSYILADSGHSKSRYKGFHFINNNIPYMILSAYGKPLWFAMSRLIFENIIETRRYITNFQEDENKLENDAMKQADYRRERLFSYEIIAPFLSDNERYQIMRNDLTIYFRQTRGLNIYFENRKTRCFTLISKDKVKLLSENNSTGTYSHSFNKEREAYMFQAIAMADLANILESCTYVPIVDETRNKSKIDITLPVSINLSATRDGNFIPLRKVLQQHGLDLIETERELEMLVFKENGTK